MSDRPQVIPQVIQLSGWNREIGRRTGRVEYVNAAHLVRWAQAPSLDLGSSPPFTRVYLSDGSMMDAAETPEQIAAMFAGQAIEHRGPLGVVA